MILNNELTIFIIIIILIGLSYYDLKYSIIFCIILYLVYLYFNKLTYESNYDEYKQYDDEINYILKDIEKYRNYDNQNYKLGSKYHNIILKNIKLLNNISEKYIFKSVLEKTRVFLEKMIEKFRSILFSMDNIEESTELTIYIDKLNSKFNQLIEQSIFMYNNKNSHNLDCEESIFCNKDLLLNLYLDNDVKIEDSKPTISHDIFDRGKYIGILGNEVDYNYGENFNSNLRATIMHRILHGNKTLKGTPETSIEPIYDSKSTQWSKIENDRFMSDMENRQNKIGDDMSRILNTHGQGERNKLYRDAADQFVQGIQDGSNYMR
tara:strand:+ start:422 stop:1387 length:966 start_codon:yes stop_codon:yes gene_type:complete